MALMPQPLSLHERRALAEQLRREAAEKIKEAERIEEGVKADEAEWLAAIEKAVATQNGLVPNAEVSGGGTPSAGLPGYASAAKQGD